MSLLVEMTRGDTILGNGTGFVVKSARGAVLLTNRHVVTGRKPDGTPLIPDGLTPTGLRIGQNKKGHLGSWVFKDEPLYDQGHPRWIEHPRLGS
jgi:hypothetical protein